jgi:hypothetical protein
MRSGLEKFMSDLDSLLEAIGHNEALSGLTVQV